MNGVNIHDLIEWTSANGEKRIERLLWIIRQDSADTDQYYFIPVIGSRAWPFARSGKEVEDAFAEQRAKLIELKDCPEAVIRHLTIIGDNRSTTYQKKFRNKVWELIGPLVMDPQRPFSDPRAGGLLIRATAAQAKVHRCTLYKYLRRCWQRGGIRDAVQSDSRNSGAPGGRHTRGSVSLGRRPKLKIHPITNQEYRNPSAKALSKEDEAFFAKAINKYRLGKRLSLRKSFRFLLQDHYSVARSGNSDFKDLKPISERPSYIQFRHYWKHHFKKTNEQQLIDREGELVHARKFRAVTRSASRDAGRPGAVYQIDSTVLDVNVVHSLYPEIVIGRPTLYWVVDVFSTMITGFYLGFESASYNTATLALWNAYRNKVELCAEFGIPIKEEHWPARGLPARLVADRGEVLSGMAEELVKIGIDITNTPPYRADLKGLVERLFKMINERIVHELPSAVDQSNDPSKPDERRQACLDLYRLTRIIILVIMEYNSKHKKGYHLTEEMEADRVVRNPVDIWTWGMSHLTGMLQHMDANYVRVALLPSIDGSVTREALIIEELRYSSPVLTPRYSEARMQGRQKVKLHYDPFLVNTVYLLGETDKDLQACTLAEQSSAHTNSSWVEYRQWKKRRSAEDYMGEAEDIANANNFDALIKKEIKEAKKFRNGRRVDLTKIKEGKEHQQNIDRKMQNDKPQGAIPKPDSQPSTEQTAPVTAHEDKALEMID